MGFATLEKQRAYMLLYNAEHRAELQDKARERYLRNRDLILAERREYRKSNLPAIQVREQAYRPRRRALRHGLSEVTVERTYQQQAGLCAICREPHPRTGRDGLVIDHDHDTGARRGLICRTCNIALPLIERFGKDWAEWASAYLVDPPLAVAVTYAETCVVAEAGG